MHPHHFRMKPIALLLACGMSVNHGVWAAEPAVQDVCQGNWKTILTVGGGLLGAVLGSQVGDGNGKLIATAVGGLGGAWLGNYIGGEIDRRHCELDKIAKANELKLSAAEVELKPVASPSLPTEAESQKDAANETSGKVDVTTWHGLEHFKSGSAELTSKAVEYFSAAAKQYDSRTSAEVFLANEERENTQQAKPQLSKGDRDKKFQELVSAQNLRPIVLVGYTDDTGDSLANQQLSEKRARAVALVFSKQKIPASRIFFRGAGETEPIADNRTDEGRTSNRRVEIVELESKDKLENFMALKESNLKYYRTKRYDSDEHAVTVDKGSDDAQVSSSSGGGRKSGSKSKAQGDHDQRVAMAAASEPAPVPASAGGELPTTPSAALGSKAKQKTAAKADVSSSPAAEVDFGGEPFNGKMDVGVVKAMGAPVLPKKGLFESVKSGGWNPFIKEAQAADDHVYTAPCTADLPRYGGEYLSLETGQALKAKTKTSSYAPGLYQTSWVGEINGNYVGVSPVAVLRDSFKSASEPSLYVYANTENPGANAKPTLKIPVAVNVYPGDKGILYRMFSKGKSGFVCADVILPLKAPFNALNGNVYYKRQGGIYEANFVPTMLVLNK